MLKKIFNLVLHSARELRRNNLHADGLKFWKPIKNVLSEYDGIKASSWKHIKKQHHTILNLPEYYIDGLGNQNIIEKNHFLIQTIRLPLTEKPSLRKVIQVALNIGQYTGSGGKKQEWMNLECYLTQDNIAKISRQIPSDVYDRIKIKTI